MFDVMREVRETGKLRIKPGLSLSLAVVLLCSLVDDVCSLCGDWCNIEENIQLFERLLGLQVR